MRRTALTVLVVGFAFAACSDDDSDRSGPGSGSTAEFCADAEAAASTDPNTGEEQLDALEAFAESAPDEIADDFDVVIEVFRESVENQSALNTAQVDEAATAIEEYVLDACGVELDPTPTSGG